MRFCPASPPSGRERLLGNHPAAPSARAVLAVGVSVLMEIPWCSCVEELEWTMQGSNPSLCASESGEFLNCEGSGLYVLQSCCK